MLSFSPPGEGGSDSLGRWVMSEWVGKVRDKAPAQRVTDMSSASAWGLALPLARVLGWSLD